MSVDLLNVARIRGIDSQLEPDTDKKELLRRLREEVPQATADDLKSNAPRSFRALCTPAQAPLHGTQELRRHRLSSNYYQICFSPARTYAGGLRVTTPESRHLLVLPLHLHRWVGRLMRLCSRRASGAICLLGRQIPGTVFADDRGRLDVLRAEWTRSTGGNWRSLYHGSRRVADRHG